MKNEPQIYDFAARRARPLSQVKREIAAQLNERVKPSDRKPDAFEDWRATLIGAGHWCVILALFGVAWLGYVIAKKLGWMR